MTFESVAGHSDDVILYKLEILSVRERLSYCSVDRFLLRIIERIGFLSESLETVDVLCSNLCVLASVHHLAAVGLLAYRILRHTDNRLGDLDVQ